MLLQKIADGSVNFSVVVEGGGSPYTYTWDLNGDGVFDESGNVLQKSVGIKIPDLEDN